MDSVRPKLFFGGFGKEKLDDFGHPTIPLYDIVPLYYNRTNVDHPPRS